MNDFGHTQLLLTLIEEVDEMTLHAAKDVGTARQLTMLNLRSNKQQHFVIFHKKFVV